MRHRELLQWIAADDRAALDRAARRRPLALLRRLTAVCTGADDAQLPAVLAASGRVFADPARVPDGPAREHLRGLFWLLNDESGAVPLHVPLLIAELLLRRPELQASFVPLLGAQLCEPEQAQSGPILADLLRALERLGPVAVRHCPACLEVLQRLGREDPDAQLRALARAVHTQLREAAAQASSPSGGRAIG